MVIGIILILIYYQLTSGAGKTSLISIWQDQRQHLYYPYLWICIALMPLNWWLEAFKFQKLMSPHLKFTLRTAVFSVLSGLAAGIVTPGRIGEYAGRLMTSDADYKTEVISATLLGSIAQNICNIAGGIIFSYFFLKSALNVTYDNTFAFVAGVMIQIVILMVIYYNLPRIAHMIEKWLPHRWILKFSNKLKSLDLYHAPLLHKVLGISFLRYMVYFLQYILIIMFFDVDGTLKDIAANVAGIYMIQTGIPLPAFLSVMARGEVAVLVWSGLGVSSMIALASTFTLWIINLIFPSLVGLTYIYYQKIDFKKFI